MRWKAIELSLCVFGALFITVLSVDALRPLNTWPLIAIGGVVLMLSAIALGARRSLPSGGPL